MLDTFTQIFLTYTSERLAVWDLVQMAPHCVRSPSAACPVSKISRECCLLAQVNAPWIEGATLLCGHRPQLKAAKQTLLQVHEVFAPECVCRVSVPENSFFNQEALSGPFHCRASTTAEYFSLQSTASNLLLAGNNQP